MHHFVGAPSFSAPSYCEVSGSSYKSGTSKECVEVSKASKADCAAVSVREVRICRIFL